MGPNQGSGRPGVSPTVTRIELAGFYPFVLLLIGWDIVRTYLPAIILWLGTAGPADQQQPAPPPIAGPAGSYTFSIPGAVRISYGPTWIRIEWDAASVAPPITPAPIDPGTVKPPAPVDPAVVEPPMPQPPAPPAFKPIAGPLKGDIWLALVRDATQDSTRPQAQRALFDPKLDAAMGQQDRQLHWHAYDIGPKMTDADQPITLFEADVKKIGGNGVLVIAKQPGGAEVVASYPIPDDLSSLAALAKKLRGQ